MPLSQLTPVRPSQEQHKDETVDEGVSADQQVTIIRLLLLGY